MIGTILVLSAAFFTGTAFPAQAQERLGSDVACKQVGNTLNYECLLTLKGALSGKPLEGAAIAIGADMPSMPMAHNVEPVDAVPTGTPGQYKFRIALPMHGEWSFKIRMSQPRRDLIIHKMTLAPE